MAISFGALGLAGLGAGLDMFGKFSAQDRQYKQQKQAVNQRNAQAVMARNAQNLQAHQIQKGIVKQQIALYNEAAERAYLGASLNRDRQLTALAFQRQDLAAELLEAVGANTASIEGDNRSAQLAAAKRTYGRFGRMQTQAEMQVDDINESARMQVKDIAGNVKARNLQAYSQVAIAPYMQQELGPAFQMAGPSRPSGLSNALMIGQGLLGAASTYNSLAAPQDKIFSYQI
jgi:hypothetical protein